ncbi:hypothetical protein ACWDX7_17795, partial [Streptomyces sp. NPDC003034]
MVAIEEELVAGESPDKSVDEAAPGAAESSAERDPRLSVFRPRDPEHGSGGPTAEPDPKSDSAQRDPLREAVAAWVATADASPAPDERPAPTPPPRPDDATPAKPPADAAAAAEAREDSAAADADPAAAGGVPGAGSAAAGGAGRDSASAG